jgi:DNA-binding MarR family transcriptional regulator
MALRNRLEHLLAGYGLTHSRFMILAALHLSTACPIAVSDLARRVGVTTPTLTSVLSGMVRDMLVRRSRDPADRRTVLVAIEQSGVDLLDQVLPVLCRRQARVMGDLTEEERRELSRLMSKVRPERLFPDQSPEQPADRADPE